MIKIDKFPYTPVGDRRAKKWHYLNEAKKMNKYIKDGDVVYDCGANIFDHSIFFALNNPSARIVAFEPIGEYYKMGLKNAEHFNVKNIIAMNVALGGKKSKMSISIENEGSSLILKSDGLKIETIEVETIDDLVSKKIIPAPNVIKIDVEGFALPLIKGAIKTIEKYKPIIMIEIHPYFVGDNEAKQKIYELQKMGLNVIEQFAMGREFVLADSKAAIDFEKSFAIHKIEELRSEYDKSTSEVRRIELIAKYKKIKQTIKIPLFKKMIWSKLFVLFSLRFLKGRK